MNDYQLEMVAKSADFLFAHKLSRNFLYETIKESFEAKRNLIELLGFEEEKGLLIRIPVTKESEDDFTLFVKEVCNLLSTPDNIYTPIDKLFIQDGKKNKFKVTRIMNNELWVKTSTTEIGKRMIYLMKKWQERDIKDIFREQCYVDEVRRDFPVWYGEQIKDDLLILLSANPYDFLRASVNCSFTSCYNPSGAAFNGVLASMLSPDTLISMVVDQKKPDYKIGRSWVYANEDQIICARQYGGITDTHHLHIRNFIYGKFGGDWVFKPELKLQDNLIDFEGPGYPDRGVGNVIINKNVKDINKIKKIDVPRAICLYCGTRFNNNNVKGVCKSCVESVKEAEMAE